MGHSALPAAESGHLTSAAVHAPTAAPAQHKAALITAQGTGCSVVHTAYACCVYPSRKAAALSASLKILHEQCVLPGDSALGTGVTLPAPLLPGALLLHLPPTARSEL